MAKKAALDYAWSFFWILKKHAKRKKRVTENFSILLILFTFAGIAISIIYDKVYPKSTGTKTQHQQFLYLSTILVPLVVTSLKQKNDRTNPKLQWAASYQMASKIESEILKYRCQVGPYHAEDKSEGALHQTLFHFAKEVKGVWATMKDYISATDITIPDTFWNINLLLDEVVVLQKSDASAPQFRETAVTRLADKEPPLEVTPLLRPPPSENAADDSSDDEENPSPRELVDDRMSPMTAEDYIHLRMRPVLCAKSQQTRRMMTRNGRINFLVAFFTIISAAVASLSLQYLVPVVLGVMSGCGSLQEQFRYGSRIELANAAIVELNRMKLWWMGLSTGEKLLPHNKAKLVLESESIIMTEINSAFGVRV